MTREEAIKMLKKLYQRTDITDEYGDKFPTQRTTVFGRRI